ncbi:acyltransferase family protein [Falsiroseomonas sp. HW251]|uniref:acyltransferase family protein n=1 Tax=Falsiroseomonas sp. HW251 TaxID=3390998 RepID=UPI003D320025
MEREAGIDGIRGLAILGVIVAHWIADPFRSSIATLFGTKAAGIIGSLTYGVDVFFVVSGYLIGRIIFKECNREYFLRGFLIRRALRILPLYYLCVLIFGAYAAFIGGYPDTAPPVWAYLVFLQNFMSGRPTLIFNPYWSVAIEVQFYVVAALAAAACGRRGLIAFGVLLMAVSPSMRALGPTWDLPSWTSPLWRSDALGLGVLLAADRSGRLSSALSATWTALGFVAADTTMMVAGSSGLIVALRANHAVAVCLSPAWLRLCGRMCFSLYLLHQAVLFGLVVLTDNLNPGLPAILAAFGVLLVLCFVIEECMGALLPKVVARSRRALGTAARQEEVATSSFPGGLRSSLGARLGT